MITIKHHKEYTTVHSSDYRLYGFAVSNYALGITKPNYPMPAIRTRTFDSLYKLGYVSAENRFDVNTVFEYYIKD